MTSLFLIVEFLLAQPTPTAVPTHRTSGFIIQGNTCTGDAAILDVLYERGFQTGGLLPSRLNALMAELELSWKFRDRFDFWFGKRPIVRILPANPIDPNEAKSPIFHDIVAEFPERPPKKDVDSGLSKD